MNSKENKKLSKTTLLLLMYDNLRDNGVEMHTFCEEFGISDSTFKRYIQEIRSFICNAYIPYEIIYQKSDNRYYLKRVSL